MRTVAVVGTGLIGTSVALAARRRGLTTYLLDRSSLAVGAAVALNAGVAGPPPEPVDLAVIAVPPAQLAPVLKEQQDLGLAHWYTDVSSVKARTRTAAEEAGCDLGRFVGGHPMAGSERSGPFAAAADLFQGRNWVLTPSRESDRHAVDLVLQLVALCGARPILMEEDDHDRAVALVSHAPHLVASVLSAQLESMEPGTARLAGQGLRDTTRVAGGSPGLWTDILGTNAVAVADILAGFSKDLDQVLDALRDIGADDPQRRRSGEHTLGELLSRGVAGQDRVPRRGPGRPGDGNGRVSVPVANHPEAVEQLFADVWNTGMHIVDLNVDHVPDEPFGRLDLTVDPEAADDLAAQLTKRGWAVLR
ncbi:prephenate dehydrogenase [Kitasatospora sp. NPDC003701]